MGAHPSLTVIQMSTVGLAALSWLASSLPPGTALLDAPVLGSVAEAESGSLVIFVGGPAVVTERWSPLLSELGSPIPVGGLGSGSAAKLVANSSLFGVLGVLGEALALGAALGLPSETVFRVLATTPLAAQADRRRPSIEANAFPPRFSLALARKDADLILEAASESGLQMPLAAAARSWLVDAERKGRADQDYSAVIAHILDVT